MVLGNRASLVGSAKTRRNGFRLKTGTHTPEKEVSADRRLISLKAIFRRYQPEENRRCAEIKLIF